MTRFALLVAMAFGTLVPAAALSAGGDPGQAKRHGNPAGWRIDFPAGWQLERSGQRCRRVVGQATVATFPMRRAVSGHHTRRSCGWSVKPPLDLRGSFPPDGVAFRVTCLSRGLFGALPPPSFPLTLAQLAPVDASVPTQGAPRPLMRLLLHRGFLFNVSLWVGDRAPPTDRQALQGVLASLRFVQPRRTGMHRCEPK